MSTSNVQNWVDKYFWFVHKVRTYILYKKNIYQARKANHLDKSYALNRVLYSEHTNTFHSTG